MKIDRSNCEQFLTYVVSQILRARVTSVSALLATPSLKALLMQALDLWGTHIACAQHTVTEVGRDVGMDRSEMVSDFVSHIFSVGTHEENPYPRLTRLLCIAREDGAEAVAPYLMRTARNRALDLERRYEVRRERAGELHGFTQDDVFGVIDPGEGRDDALPDMDETLIRQEGIAAFLSQMGSSFVSDVVILADAVGIRRKKVAQYFFSGRQRELVAAVTLRLSQWLHRDMTACMNALRAQASAYVLPARFRGDYDALLAYLYRQSSGAARNRLACRLQACGL